MHVFLGYRPGKIPAERDRRRIYFQYHATLEILWGRCRPAQGIFSHARRSSKQTNAGDGCEKEGKPEILGDENYGNAERFVETDDHRMVAVPEKSGLKRTLDNRHVQFIALGGGIGTGLFISSGTELATGGPGSLLINFIIIGIMLISVVFALGELAVTLPVSGAYSAYATRFIDPAWGFAMGYNYFIKWIISAPIEFTAATIMVATWDEDNNIVPWSRL